MQWMPRAGTPNHMKEPSKPCETETQVRNWMSNALKPHIKHADKFARDVAVRLRRVQAEIDGQLVLAHMPKGSIRAWEVTDEAIGITLHYEIERLS